MIRKFSAIALAVSFLALSTSGMMMFVIEQPSFTIQMHPVHKLFGLVMILSAVTHLLYNYRTLWTHLKNGSTAVFASVLVVMLVLLYGAAINNPVPDDLALQMDTAAAQAEHQR